MTRVLTPLDLRYLGGRRFVLLSTFSVDTDAAGRIDVPPGQPTDFNSVPIGFWNILPPTDFGEASVVHDELYFTGLVRGLPIAREIADKVHRELVIWTGQQPNRERASAWKVAAYYYGLRCCGGRVWNKYRAADQSRLKAKTDTAAV